LIVVRGIEPERFFFIYGELMSRLQQPAVSDGVLPIVTIAEIGEMPFKDGVELIAITRNVLGPRRSHQLNSASCRRNKQ